mgnify:CR=1 FL=1
MDIRKRVYTGGKCDLSGSPIEKMEPFITGPSGISVKSDTHISDYFVKNSDGYECMAENVSIKPTDTYECHECSNSNNLYELYRGDNFVSRICSNCIEYTVQEMSRVRDVINSSCHYYDKSGFVIYNYDDKKSFKDFLGGSVQSHSVLKIGCSGATARTSLTNIEKLCEYFYNPSSYSIINKSVSRDEDYDNELCRVCGERNKVVYIIKEDAFRRFDVCDKCRKNLCKSLIEYSENHKDEIVSLML